MKYPQGQGCGTCQYGGEPHRHPKSAKARAQAPFGGGGRFPFEQVALPPMQPAERSRDGIQRLPCLLHEKAQGQRHLAGRGLEPLARITQMKQQRAAMHDA